MANKSKEDCIFCQMIAGEKPAYVIDETEQTIVILSLENHPLVIPKKHIKNIYQLDQETGCKLTAETIKTARAVKSGMEADGVYISQLNEPAAGQKVFHLHLHVIPRYEGKKQYSVQNQTKTYKEKLVTKIQAGLDKGA